MHEKEFAELLHTLTREEKEELLDFVRTLVSDNNRPNAEPLVRQ